MSELIVGHVYTVHIVDGFAEINSISPLQPIRPGSDGWRVVEAVPTSAREHVHIGIAVRFDPLTNLGVILLGSRHPRQAHRFVPWVGTPGLKYQTSQRLLPSPPDTFLDYPGYINFSHAVLVRVLGRREYVNAEAKPGSAILEELGQRSADIISLPPLGLSLCKTLHSDYWEGVRYDTSADGPAPDGRAPDGGGDSSEQVSMAFPQHEGASSPPWNPNNAQRVASLIHRRELRVLQLRLLDDDFDLSNDNEAGSNDFVKMEPVDIWVEPLTASTLTLLESV